MALRGQGVVAGTASHAAPLRTVGSHTSSCPANWSDEWMTYASLSADALYEAVWERPVQALARDDGI
jgi:hypothetical protein